ncbi:MAG: hypothetical protein ACI81R_000202 [Bradymonadia bacterium]|jgi:hypothetical protein
MPLPTSVASERNKQIIATTAAAFFAPRPRVLEIASGYGAHGEHICQTVPGVAWTPSDRDADALNVLAARAKTTPGLLPPLPLDVCRPPERLPTADIVFCANMIHIAPWAATAGLFEVAARVLSGADPPRAGVMLTYGPYRFDGAFTSQSNAEFDGWLKERDPSFGIRDIEALDELAKRHGAGRETVFDMPANNHLVVWRFPATSSATSHSIGDR